MQIFLRAINPFDFIALGVPVDVGDDGGEVLLLVKLADHTIINVGHSHFVQILLEIFIF